MCTWRMVKQDCANISKWGTCSFFWSLGKFHSEGQWSLKSIDILECLPIKVKKEWCCCRGRTPEWYNKSYGHICALYLTRIRGSFKHNTEGPESKVWVLSFLWQDGIFSDILGIPVVSEYFIIPLQWTDYKPVLHSGRREVPFCEWCMFAIVIVWLVKNFVRVNIDTKYELRNGI